MAKETHILTKDHSMIVDGRRVTLAAGTPVTPSASMLANLPDRFVEIAGGSVPRETPAEPEAGEEGITAEGLAKMTVAKVSEMVADVDDVEWLHGLREMEEAGKARKGVLAAIDGRLYEMEEGWE